MTGIDFLQKMNDIDEDLLEGASEKPSRHRHSIYGWALLAAGLLLFAGIGYMTFRIPDSDKITSDSVVAFSLEDKTYELFGKADYITFGLCEDEEDARTALSVSALTKDDLGERMGVIAVTVNGKKVKCNVYHYKSYPDDENVCVLEFPKGEYRLFISEGD